MTKKVDYIIVGQGIAGTCLAFQLLRKGKKVIIFDENREHTSSKVAAGLYNPVTGRKMVLTWKANKLFPAMLTFYKEIEIKLNTSFLHEIPIYRPFVSMEEQNEWMGQSSDPDYQPFIKRVHTSGLNNNHLKDEFGGLELKQSGYLDIITFLSNSRDFFLSENQLIEDTFNDELILTDTKIQYQDIECDKVIFCSGMDDNTNKYFDWLPFSLVKGEILEIEPEENFEIIYNRGVFIMPRKDGSYKLGATYDNKDLSLSITEKGRNTLIEKLEAIFKLNYKIINQKSGIRPATRDRRPFIGLHPELDRIGIFNGLGTKGVTLAPYFAEQFAYYLVDNGELDSEININRFKFLYYDK